MNLIVSRNRILLVFILSGRESRFCWCYQHWSHTMKYFEHRGSQIIFPVWKVHDRAESHRLGYSINTAVLLQYRQRYRQLQRYSSSEIGFTCIPSRWIRRKRGQRWCCLMWRTRWSNKTSRWEHGFGLYGIRTHFLVLLVLDEVMHDTTVKYNQSVPEIVSSVSLPKENYKEKETIFSIKLKFEI